MWSTPGDWTSGAPPTVVQQACVTIGLSSPVVLTGTVALRSLTVGGADGASELELDGASLSLGANSSISTTGRLEVEGAPSSLVVATPATLTNNGAFIVDYKGLALSGSLTNARDGVVTLPETGGWEKGGYAPTLTLEGPSTFKNLGLVVLEHNAVIVAPADGQKGAVIYNAGGTIENGGDIKVEVGGTFLEGSGSVVGPEAGGYAVQIQGGALALDGAGPASFQLSGSPVVSGLLARDETLLTYASSTRIAGSFTNNGMIVADYGASTLTIPAGYNFYNAGTIETLEGHSLAVAGNFYNEPTGAILLAGSDQASSFGLSGATKLVNLGTISLGANAELYDPTPGSSGAVVDNAGGTIADDGGLYVTKGGTFVEGRGTETGNAVLVQNADLELAGPGASSFAFSGGRLTGNIGAHQDVWLSGTVVVPASFANLGTLSAKGAVLVLPPNGTLTNDGSLDTPPSSQEFVLDGSLVNSSVGVVNMNGNSAYGGGLDLERAGTVLRNDGLVEMAHGSIGLFATGQSFDNNGVIRFGVYGGSWGGFGLHSEIETSPGDTVKLGGVIDPEFAEGMVPALPWPRTAAAISYGMVLAGDANPDGIKISCSASVGGNWTISCTTRGESAATLTAKSTTSLSPTLTTVTSSSPRTTSGQITSGYGEPVVLTATVASEHGPAPSGTVTFYDMSANAGSIELLGTVPVSSSAGISSARLATYGLLPGAHHLEVFYSGDASSLPSLSSDIAELVTPEATTTALSPIAASYFGQRVTLKATVRPNGTGPAKLGGEVVFVDANENYLGASRVSTSGGTTTATVTTAALYPGTDPVSAWYSGDTNYLSSSSLFLSAVVKPPLARRR
jgi:hypothetical protein